ncbi:uncharacterized protein CLUP02_03787 [Colletotrichum lupini]|uniref:Uncharacterized protein n=1 Tax=Colletotrichum lupini TaxID=145971 RepID=A0A9Q8SJZ9_9PEZI|nr:uncharacterized protein CLUP02_03787 [Colletotrichum lupini]UQC78310.1 hypothetical protein CLUP02_03787 [Colletotrichum lupini]
MRAEQKMLDSDSLPQSQSCLQADDPSSAGHPGDISPGQEGMKLDLKVGMSQAQGSQKSATYGAYCVSYRGHRKFQGTPLFSCYEDAAANDKQQPLTRRKERAPLPGSCTPALRHPPPRSYGYVPSLCQTLPKAVTDTGSRRRLEMLLPITERLRSERRTSETARQTSLPMPRASTIYLKSTPGHALLHHCHTNFTTTTSCAFRQPDVGSLAWSACSQPPDNICHTTILVASSRILEPPQSHNDRRSPSTNPLHHPHAIHSDRSQPRRRLS